MAIHIFQLMSKQKGETISQENNLDTGTVVFSILKKKVLLKETA